MPLFVIKQRQRLKSSMRNRPWPALGGGMAAGGCGRRAAHPVAMNYRSDCVSGAAARFDPVALACIRA